MTGQHADLELADYGFAGQPIRRLDCPGEEDPHRHVGSVTGALLPLFAREPDLVIVQGDTSSALGGALAAFTAGVPVAHVEAGLRSHDPHSPWPEEEYRTAIDAEADLLFAPTSNAASNLRSERVRGEIHVTGNTGIDAVLAAEAKLPPMPSSQRDHRILVTCHRRESWGQGLESIAAAIAELARDVPVDFVLHPNRYVRERMHALLGTAANVSLLEPSGQRELLRRMRSCKLALSDSGGLQEEAPALGVPLLVLREKTERPEGVATGNAILVGTSTERIVGMTRRLLGDPLALEAMSRRSFPYGDGRAAPRIASIIDQWLERRVKRPAWKVAGPGVL